MSGHCRDCKHFYSGPVQSTNAAAWSACDRAEGVSGEAKDDTSLAYAWDREQYEASLFVSPDFGCIQFESRP